MPLREGLDRTLKQAFETFATDKPLHRSLLRIMHSIGLMPVLASSQEAFASALATALRARDDVRKDDLDTHAYVLVNAAMGVVHTLIWTDQTPMSVDAIRAGVVDMCVNHLRPPPPDAKATPDAG
jgi:hypothetical protein